MAISKYVDNKELKRIVEEGNLKPYKVKYATKKQGIIFASTAPGVIAQQLYPILWGCHDISEFKDSIDDAGNYIKSSLIEFNSKSDEDILESLEASFLSSNYLGKQYSFGSLTKINKTQLSMRLKYPKARVGKNELMSTQNRYIDIYITKVKNDRAVFDIRQASTTEMKEINKFIKEVVQSNSDLYIRHINLDNLTKENKLKFFDSFNLHKFNDWKFITVTKIELKKDTYIDDDDEISLGDDDGLGDTTGNLNGITSAIVNGTSLRTNSFIQDCLKNQFSIATMGYKFESKSEFTKVIIEINFKHSDVKIDISKTYEYDEIEETERVHPLLYDTQEDIIKVFQNAAYNIYTEIVESEISKTVQKKSSKK